MSKNNLSTSKVAVVRVQDNSKTIIVNPKKLSFPDLSFQDIVTLLMYCHIVKKRLVYDKTGHKAIIINHELDDNIAFVQKIDGVLIVLYKRNTNPMLPDAEVVDRAKLELIMYNKYNQISYKDGKIANKLIEIMDRLFKQAEMAL